MVPFFGQTIIANALNIQTLNQALGKSYFDPRRAISQPIKLKNDYISQHLHLNKINKKFYQP
jgi:hypothetical protein